MLVVSDVHDSPKALARLVALGEPILILGDLVNLADYRTGEGAVAEVLGRDISVESGEARGRGDYSEMRELWKRAVGDRGIDARREIGLVLDRQYEAMATALGSGTGIVTHGNVDRPELLQQRLPGGFRYVHGEVVEMEGLSLGIVGGGMPTPAQAMGEVADEEMAELLADMGGVDVLCTHVPAALRPVRFDVITGRDTSEGIVIMLPPHTGPVTLTFDLHNRHIYSEELIRNRQAYRHYTATIGVLTDNNDLLSRFVVQNEFRAAGDLVDRIAGDVSPGGLKAVAPTGLESISVEIPADAVSSGQLWLYELAPRG